eukprot:scaffold198643_cov26-Tisochrysis_lutea.AAC.1
MDPAMMAQAQAMMSNPGMAQQAQQAMANLSAEDIQRRMSALPQGDAGAPPLPARPVSVVAQLRGSAMSISNDVLELIEEAEGLKLEGNNKFKQGEYESAASRYRQGCKLIDSVLNKKVLTGADKKAVVELLDACQLNTANCRLKLEDWDGAKELADTVLARGDNRKAFFRRGQAYQNMGKLEDARIDLLKASKMNPADSIVATVLAEVEARLGVEPTSADAPPPAPAAPVLPPAPPGIPVGPNGQPDYKQMEAMLDQISPDQLKQQAAMLENMDPAQLAAVSPQFAGMDPAQVKAMTSMMANMDPAMIKQMTKMASQMGGLAGATGRAPNASAAGPSTPALPALPPQMPVAPGGGTPGLGAGVDMMANMSPEMMQAGIDMMSNMDPAALAGMAKMMGMDEKQAEKMQQAMSKMSPEDLKKWTGRAQKVAKLTAKPVMWYRTISEYVSSTTVLAVLVGLLAIFVYGHMTESF